MNANKDQNQRYRKSLVFNNEDEDNEVMEQAQMDNIWQDINHEELYQEFEKKNKQKKTLKSKKKLDFDEMTSSMFEHTQNKCKKKNETITDNFITDDLPKAKPDIEFEDDF